MFEVSSPQAMGFYFLLLVSAVGVLCRLCVGRDFCLLSGGRRWVLFLWWAGVLGCLCSLSADDCICVPVLLVACVKHPALGAAGRWVVPDLGFGWRHSWAFSLIPPGVRRSLTFWCPGLVVLPLLFTVRSVIVFKWMLHIYLWKRLPCNGLP